MQRSRQCSTFFSVLRRAEDRKQVAWEAEGGSKELREAESQLGEAVQWGAGVARIDHKLGEDLVKCGVWRKRVLWSLVGMEG